MDAEANRRLLEEVFAAFAAGDPRPLGAAMREDVRWHLRGSASWAKTYEGRGAVAGELFPRLAARMRDPIRLVPDRVVADGDVVVVEAHSENTTVDGEPYFNRYCFVFRLADGAIAEVAEYMDTALGERVLGP